MGKRKEPLRVDVTRRATPSTSSGVDSTASTGSRSSAHAFPHHAKQRESLLSVTKVKESPEFAGFINLGIVGACIYGGGQVLLNLERGGVPFELSLFHKLSSDYSAIALVMLWLVVASFGAFGIVLGHVRGWLPPQLTNALFQCFICLYFALPIKFVLSRDMPIISSAFLVTETIVMVMKLQSYVDTNLILSSQGTVPVSAQMHRETSEQMASPRSAVLDEELAVVVEPVAFPDNVTAHNFFMYLCFPTLVYEPYYPRTNRVRGWFIVAKLCEIFACLFLFYFILESYIYPVYHSLGSLSYLAAMVHLVIPSMALWLTTFILIFHCILNAIAELTRFADRLFYQDWWNSTSYDEFARKWNIPVHEWLFRHFYLHAIRNRGFSKRLALYGTFIYSAIIHEVVLAVTLRMFRWWTAAFMALELVIIFASKKLFRAKYKRLGNIFCLTGLFIGFPLMQISYATEYWKARGWME